MYIKQAKCYIQLFIKFHFELCSAAVAVSSWWTKDFFFSFPEDRADI